MAEIEISPVGAVEPRKRIISFKVVKIEQGSVTVCVDRSDFAGISEGTKNVLFAGDTLSIAFPAAEVSP